jgi:hypothetical protein
MNPKDELVSARWGKAYQSDKGTWTNVHANGRTESAFFIYQDLLTLEDTNAVTQKAVNNITGSDCWYGYRCSSCNMMSTKPLIMFDTASDDPWICMPCLRIAYVKLSQAIEGIEDANSDTTDTE